MQLSLEAPSAPPNRSALHIVLYNNEGYRPFNRGEGSVKLVCLKAIAGGNFVLEHLAVHRTLDNSAVVHIGLAELSLASKFCADTVCTKQHLHNA